MDKINVLVVEDDASTQLLYKKVFPDDLYECIYAKDGKAALEKYKKKVPDLIVLDMMLPVMPGFLVLHKIRKEHNDTRTKIIVSTSLSGRSDIVACTKLGIQGYIVKPFNFKDVRKRIMTMLGMQDSSIEEEAVSGSSQPTPTPSKRPKDIIKGIIISFANKQLSKTEAVKKIIAISKAQRLDLPSLPQMVFRIQEAMSGQDSTAKTLADIISTDQGLSTKLISLANSSFYRGVNKCQTAEDAVRRVGMIESKELAIVISNRSLYALKDSRFEDDINTLFYHSVATGVAARHLATRLKMPNQDFIFSLGIMHDLGKLILCRIFAEVFLDDTDVDIALLRKIIEEFHNRAGGIFLSSLGFANQVAKIVLHHDNPHQKFESTDRELPVIVMANLLARKLGFGVGLPADKQDIYSNEAAKFLKIGPDIEEKTKSLIDAYFEMLQAAK